MAYKPRVVAKSADYTIKFPMDAHDTEFTNYGASGAVIFTLPAALRQLLGVRYRFRAVVNQDITVKPPAVDTLIAVNDLAADSVAMSTTNEKIGGLMEATCVQTGSATYQWVVNVLSNGHTGTVAT